MKLFLNTIIPVPVYPLTKIKGFSSPVGWWTVTTEGDVEGRTTNKLGEFYGHIAEIAFHLADKASWKLTFRPFETRKLGKRLILQATKKGVWVDINGIKNAVSLAKWLDAEGIKVSEKTTKANLYGAVYLELI